MKSLNYTSYVNPTLLPVRDYTKTTKTSVLTLGGTFRGDEELRDLASDLSDVFLKNLNKEFDWENSATSKEFFEMTDVESRFYIFVISVHAYFAEQHHQITTHFKQCVNRLAEALDINSVDVNLLLEFFQNEEAYRDNNQSLYLTGEKVGSSIKHLGSNVIWYRNSSAEVKYLKYFSNYNMFLTRSFIHQNSPKYLYESLPCKDINLVTADNFTASEFGNRSFDNLVCSVKDYRPMQYFELPAAYGNPKIVLDPDNGKLVICGSSTPFSPTHFFEPILSWLRVYRKQGEANLGVYIMLDYFNTYTSKFLLSLCRQCDEMTKEGKKVNIYWYFDPEDDDLRDFGQNLNRVYEKGLDYCLITDGIEELV